MTPTPRSGPGPGAGSSSTTRMTCGPPPPCDSGSTARPDTCPRWPTSCPDGASARRQPARPGRTRSPRKPLALHDEQVFDSSLGADPSPGRDHKGETMGTMRILDHTGDTAVSWDLDDEPAHPGRRGDLRARGRAVEDGLRPPHGRPRRGGRADQELRPLRRRDHLGATDPRWMIPSLRLVEDIPEWGTLVALVGGEHHGANVLLVPAGADPARRDVATV